MLIIIHVAIALFSIGFATYLSFSPSSKKLYISYGSILATLASGSYLVWHLHAPMLASCMTGLVYLGVVSVGVIIAHYRLATSNAKRQI